MDIREMNTLGDVVAAGRDREGKAIDAAGRTAPYAYGDFSTNVWKTGNLLRHYGIRPDARLAVVVGPKEGGETERVGYPDSPEPLQAVLGGATLAATVDITPAQPVDTRTFVLPAGLLGRYETAPGCSVIAYGGPPEAANVAHFGTETWSENPIEPPDPVEPSDIFLQVDGEQFSHETVLDVATAVVEEYGLGADDRVGLAAPVTEPGALVAGVVAPLVAGATIYLPRVDETAGEVDATLVVGTKPEKGGLAASDVTGQLYDTRRA
ncbi:MAG: hypothetical protein V5A55_00045 [Halovenus sp.]